MQISYAAVSVPGPVREHNEDCATYFQPTDAQGRRDRGVAVIIADGVGGEAAGEIASALACEAALREFQNAKPNTPPGSLLFQMFNAANQAVYDRSLNDRSRMATTLSISLLRNDELNVGHVGDCRVYLVQQGRIRRVTNDHSYAGVQIKLGLITVEEAKSSELRCVLTRSVGQDAIVRADYHTLGVHRGDFVIHCCDGLYCFVTEEEIFEAVSKMPAEQACREMIALAERRGADDNLTMQVAEIKDIERMSYYRGLPIYQKVPERSMGQDIQPGQLLDDRYAINDIIARSGMATIYKGTDTKTGQAVALKIPFMHLESDPNFFTRFKREQEIGTRLNHPYIMHVEPDDGKRSRPYMVMEYLEGQTLGHLMRSVRPMPLSDALKIASRICEGLYYMHEHDVVHRDLKPDNVMICNDGSIRIMDFGIAKVEGSRRLTFGAFQPAMGTPDYMAPEQVKGKRGDPRTDVYSLGAILYEMVTGRVPYEGNSPLLIMNARLTGDPTAPRKLNAEITPQVEEIILHAMARDPADRYPSAIEMKQDLDRPEAVNVTGRAERLQAVEPWKGGWQRKKAMILAVLIPLLIVGIWYVATHYQISQKK
jgi:serine/threonine protein phosphatase PrpC